MTDHDPANGAVQDMAALEGDAPRAADQTPVFYRQPEPLDAKRHGTLGLNDSTDYRFTAGANAIPVHVGEFALIARDYPIVFVGSDRPMPVAIVGIRQNESLFLERKGAWAPGRYIPAYVRRYPFLFLRNDQQNQLILCVDRASERVAENAQNPFFDGDQPSEFTKKALEVTSSVQQQFVATERLSELLQELGLLVPQQRTFRLYTGEQRALTDFHVVDEKRFNELDEQGFVALRNSGALGAIYCHLVSLNSWVSLVHRANALLQEAEEARNASS